MITGYRYRLGSKLGTTIYRTTAEQPCAWVPTDPDLAKRIVELLNANETEVKQLRALCGEVALSIESLSHEVQSSDLRLVMHEATSKLWAAAEGRKA